MNAENPTIADVAAEYIRTHRVERQSYQLTSLNRVEMTLIQNKWATRTGGEILDIYTAPESVVQSIETTERGHALFNRVRDCESGIVVYELIRNPR